MSLGADALFEPRALARLLAARPPRVLSRAMAPKRSAVAVILRATASGPEVLLMRRVQHDKDRWSGHVSFPGGMAQAEDADSMATATRETLEEVGLDLERDGRLIGRTDDQIAIARGRTLPMAITPWVFELIRDVPPVLGPEAESIFWLPLQAVLDGTLDAPYPYKMGAVPMELPSWRYRGYVIWGLTHRMLQALVEIAGGSR